MQLRAVGLALIVTITSVGIAESSTATALTGSCLVSAHNPHKSSHQPGRINAIAEVQCTYDPAGSLDLQSQIQKLRWYGWGEAGSVLTVLNDTATWERHSRSAECQNGSYRTLARAAAAGPEGQPKTWSLWAVGFSASISC